jgi:hypothetical protein
MSVLGLIPKVRQTAAFVAPAFERRDDAEKMTAVDRDRAARHVGRRAGRPRGRLSRTGIRPVGWWV